MARKGRRRSKSNDEVLGALMILPSLYVYMKTQSLGLAIFTFIILIFGLIAFLVIKKQIINSRLIRSGILEIDKMDGVQFEQYLKALFENLNYKAKTTKASNDFGADLLLQGSKKIVVQAKRYNKSVGIKAVQEVIPAKTHYNCDEAWVVTNNYFTNSAKSLAKSNGVILIDRDKLQNMILKIKDSAPNKIS